jgi:hypothetical protein
MDLHHFELALKPVVLKKALSLYQRGLVEHGAQRPMSRMFYVGDEKVEISVSHGRVASWTCSCGRRPYCEHFAAALFLIQKKGTRVEVPAKKESGVNATFDKLRRQMVTSLKEDGLIGLTASEKAAEPERILVDQLAFAAAVLSLPEHEMPADAGRLSHRIDAFERTLAGRRTVSPFIKDILIATLSRGLFVEGQRGRICRFIFSFTVSRFHDPGTCSLLNHVIRKHRNRITGAFQADWEKIFLTQVQIAPERRKWPSMALGGDTATAIAVCELRKTTGVDSEGLILRVLDRTALGADVGFLNYVSGLSNLSETVSGAVCERLMLYGPFISPTLWERFARSRKDARDAAEKVVKRLMAARGANWQEKVLRLLQYSGNREGLRSFLKGNAFRFSVVHEVAMELEGEGMTEVYANSLQSALRDANQASLRGIHLQRAERYLKRLKNARASVPPLLEELVSERGE